MEKIIVAFESEKTALRVKELLEGGGAAACLVCRTADQVRRAINKLPVPAVVCGDVYKRQGLRCQWSGRTCAEAHQNGGRLGPGRPTAGLQGSGTGPADEAAGIGPLHRPTA